MYYFAVINGQLLPFGFKNNKKKTSKRNLFICIITHCRACVLMFQACCYEKKHQNEKMNYANKVMKYFLLLLNRTKLGSDINDDFEYYLDC